MTERDETYDKPIAYEEGDRVIYRASSLGMCDGALVRARLGVTGSGPGEMMLERFQEGHDWEERVLLAGLGVDWMRVEDRDHLELYGKVVESQEGGGGLQVQTELAWSNKVVRCHPDAIAVHRGNLEKRVVEVKFLGAEMFAQMLNGDWKDTYLWQRSIEMLSTGLPMLYIIGEKLRVDGEVSLGSVEVLEFDAPTHSLTDVKMRVLQIEGYLARGEMPACPVPFMYPCPYWAEHEKVEKAEIEDEALTHLVESHARNAAKMEAIVVEGQQIKAQIEERMRELGLSGGRVGSWDVNVIEASEKGNVSWAKAYKALSKQTGERVDEDEFRGKPSDGYVRVSKVKTEGKGKE